MIYPQKMNSKKSDFIWKMSIAISILVAFILGIINNITTPKIPWSALVNAGIIYIWITVFYSIKKRVNIAGHVFLQTIAISLLTLAIDYELGMKGWAINIAIPIAIIIANITMLILTIVSHKKYVKYAIYQLVIVLFSMLPAILITEHITNNKGLCIVATGISIINLIISLLLCKKDLKEVIIRKFHM